MDLRERGDALEHRALGADAHDHGLRVAELDQEGRELSPHLVGCAPRGLTDEHVAEAIDHQARQAITL